MRLTDEMIQEDDKRFKRQNLLAEFNYCGKEVPKRKSITNDDIRFYAWLCRSAYALLKEQKESGWVSVKDKLPELGKNVLVYIERNAYRYDETFRKREIAIGWQMNGSWHVDGCSGVVGLYWQELPELPKEVTP